MSIEHILESDNVNFFDFLFYIYFLSENRSADRINKGPTIKVPTYE